MIISFSFISLLSSTYLIMDYLDKLTHLAQVRGEINICCEFQGEWQISHQERMQEKAYSILLNKANVIYTK